MEKLAEVGEVGVATSNETIKYELVEAGVDIDDLSEATLQLAVVFLRNPGHAYTTSELLESYGELWWPDVEERSRYDRIRRSLNNICEVMRVVVTLGADGKTKEYRYEAPVVNEVQVAKIEPNVIASEIIRLVLDEPDEWRQVAACRGLHPDMFYVDEEKARGVHEAKKSM